MCPFVRTGTKSMHYAWLLLLLAFTIGPSIGQTEPLRVFASVPPIRTFIERIGGEHVDARAMVRPGYDSHTYDPTPHQIGALAEAVLYVRTGLSFEDAWMDRIRSANPAMQVLDTRAGIELRALETHGHDDGRASHGHNAATDQGGSHNRLEEHHEHIADPTGSARDYESDPHVWTSPLLVKHMAGMIRAKLAELDPAHATDYTRNYRAFVQELDNLDREIRVLLDPLPNRKFMVFHPAWGYFANTYGLTQIPIEREGKEPGARALAALIDQAKRENIRVIFVQPQLGKHRIRQVAKAIGGRVTAVDPLAANYGDNLRAVARQFAKALQP